MALAEAVEIKTIAQLPGIIDGLSGWERSLVVRMIEVTTSVSELDLSHIELDYLPPARQLLIDTYNPWDHRKSVFNPERSKRPKKIGSLAKIEAEIIAEVGKDVLCNYISKAASNKFGRFERNSYVTAGNLYPAAQNHGLIILEHNPLAPPTLEHMLDRFDLADQWFDAARDLSPEAIYESMIENKLDKAGATILHGHAQLAAKPNRHEGNMEEYLDNAIWYHYKTGGDYFDDLFRVHQLVGLGMEYGGIRAFSSLFPFKEAEIDIFAERFDYPTRRFVFRVYDYFMNVLGAKAFNFTIGFRARGYDGRDWGKIPGVIIKFINRGDPTAKNSDVGGFESMGTSIIETDPYFVYEGLKKAVATQITL